MVDVRTWAHGFDRHLGPTAVSAVLLRVGCVHPVLIAVNDCAALDLPPRFEPSPHRSRSTSDTRPGSRTLRARTPALSRACLPSATGRSSSGRSGPPASTSDRVPAACRTRRRPSGSSREQRFSARRSVVQRVAWSVASRIRVLPNQCSKPRGLNDVRDGDERVVARRSP